MDRSGPRKKYIIQVPERDAYCISRVRGRTAEDRLADRMQMHLGLPLPSGEETRRPSGAECFVKEVISLGDSSES